jgi:hypothetical protein
MVHRPAHRRQAVLCTSSIDVCPDGTPTDVEKSLPDIDGDDVHVRGEVDDQVFAGRRAGCRMPASPDCDLELVGDSILDLYVG